MEPEAELAIISIPGMGNLVPAVEFANHLVNHHHHRISVTILALSIPQTPLIDAYLRSLASNKQVRFHHIHPLHPPDQRLVPIESVSLYIQHHKPIIKQTLDNLKISGLFVDMFCTSMIDVANDLAIPSYLFFASPAAYLGFVLHLTTLPATDPHRLTVPTYANPLPPNVLPYYCINNNENAYSWFVRHALRYKETKAILVNTFQELEPYALRSLSSSKSNRFDLPPVYPVGPIIDRVGPAKWHSNRCGHEKVIQWLDRQPSKSVVFLCFGSMGVLSRAQVREIAAALDRTGYRFLWALREPGKGNLDLPNDYEKVEESMFPEGFLDRTAEIGLICGWVSQVSVLEHGATGGFVSHCGWNSILESIWCGVPVATWPLYAEQQLNAFEMVRELGLSVEIRLDSRDNGGELVLADEVERGLRELMDGGDGELRLKVNQMSDKSRKALMENGSSFVALNHFIHNFLS